MPLISFFLGLIVGSFLNALIFRMRSGDSVWRGRSYCPKCKKTLSWYELIPIVSFIAQRGRCRGCKEKIDWQYPLVEFATGVVFLLVYWSLSIGNLLEIGNWKLEIELLVSWYLFSALIVLFMYDLRYSLVPDRVVLPAIAVALVYRIATIVSQPGPQSVPVAICYLLLATIVGALFFAVQYYLSRGRWLGDGDIRIGALMGAMLGWPQLLTALVISYIIGGACGAYVLISKRKKFGQTLPLVTFLTLGTAITFLYGPQILNWYFGL